MGKKTFLMLLLCISCSIHAISQTYYYYYQGRKIPLTLNENKVCISIPKTCESTSERIQTNVQILVTIKNENFDIFVITQSDFEKLTSLDFWEEDAKSVILSSLYFTENDQEVVSTPYLNVRLKKEEDEDLLTLYAEKYKLNIVNNSPLMPLWYILSVTLESEKSPLECANEIFESGDFATSVPDLASIASIEIESTVPNITTLTTGESSEIYDLQGRRIQPEALHKGIYIQNGKKFVVE